MSIRREDYCCEPLELVENYMAAKADDFKGWDIHHRCEILPCGRFSTDDLKKFGLYLNRPASELIWLRHGEHRMLHNIGNTYMKGKTLSAETRHKIAAANKGRHHSEETRHKIAAARKGENNPLFGKHLSDETRLKLSAANKGKHWWNDGVSCKYSRECPGPEWTRGLLIL